MANRRMFSKDVIDSDRFLDMPPTTQNLYFHLGIQADDDGFVASPKKVKRASSATDDDLKLLEAKKFIISFESGVIVIADWKLNNYIQKDRYTPTIHLEEKRHINTTENRSYKYVDTPCIQNVSNMDTQYSIAKDSIDQLSKEKGRTAEGSIEQSSLDQTRLEEDTFSYAENALDESESINLNDCIDFYQSEIGRLGNFDMKTLERLSKEYGIDFLYESLEKTAFRGDVASPLAYVTTLLKEWRRKGFTDISDITNEQEEFNEQFEEDLPF
ncbi:replisome organizer [Enterococcus dongliensis]|uniref:replisome organizer n=1 Tax=Enterococcus dongliensis TaxID=2559925 RepID=UPI0028921ADA|nr:replisome organizer [Enterococcus dongliensis]MDT2673242.1 replisome organizer [Enterococcus dongliensis]